MAGEKNKAKSGGHDNKKRKHRYLPHNVCSSSHLAACSFFPLQKLCFFQVLIWSEISKFYESYQSVRFFITTLRDWSNWLQKAVKKGGYPLTPGVQGFFITCDGGRERQASQEAISVIDSVCSSPPPPHFEIFWSILLKFYQTWWELTYSCKVIKIVIKFN